MPQKHPYFIDWPITAKCNLNCRHCRGMAPGELSTERARELVGEIACLQPGWVIIEGGEPLLRPDLFDILSLLRRHQLEVHLITNGMLLDSAIIFRLKQLGIRIMISIDGATAATYEAVRNGADFVTVVQAAKTCAQEGILEAINTTMVKNNYREIPAFFELAQTIGVRNITFIGFKPCRGTKEEMLSPAEYKEAIELACHAARKTGIKFFFDEPFFWAVVKENHLPVEAPQEGTGILVPDASNCIFGEYLFIDTDGQVKPCSFAPLNLGNVKEKRLDVIWQEALLSPLLCRIKDAGTRTGYCRSCRYLTECRGCRSRTFMLTGDWFAPDPACPLSLSLPADAQVR